MNTERDPADLPVLLLYDIEPEWTLRETEEVVSLSTGLAEALEEVGHPTTLVPVSSPDIRAVLEEHDPDSAVVLNWCEALPGVSHSEPLVARGLEQMGFAFTGASSAALALAQDKHSTKALLDRHGIPTPRWRVFDRPEADDWDAFPAIVKAVNEHCSQGITRESVVSSGAELAERIAHVLDVYDQPALVEDFIDGREFHVSLWGNGTIEVLPVAEMDFSRFGELRDRLCTYDSKCVPGSAAYEGIETILPAELAPAELRELERVCASAYSAIGCRDYGRIDVRLRDGVFHVLDINPNADISSDTSLASAAELVGYSYGRMGSRIVNLASLRHPRLCRR